MFQYWMLQAEKHRCNLAAWMAEFRNVLLMEAVLRFTLRKLAR